MYKYPSFLGCVASQLVNSLKNFLTGKCNITLHRMSNLLSKRNPKQKQANDHTPNNTKINAYLL